VAGQQPQLLLVVHAGIEVLPSQVASTVMASWISAAALAACNVGLRLLLLLLLLLLFPSLLLPLLLKPPSLLVLGELPVEDLLLLWEPSLSLQPCQPWAAQSAISGLQGRHTMLAICHALSQHHSRVPEQAGLPGTYDGTVKDEVKCHTWAYISW